MSDNLPVYTLADVEAQGRVEFEHFTKEDALELGIISARVIQELGRNLAVDIVYIFVDPRTRLRHPCW